jgi:LmbE family N-acetylglucosaminyl deacetylase
MQFFKPGAELFVPDGASLADALKRTTQAGIVAHPDDLEIVTYPGILNCFGNETEWFLGIVVTDGGGSPRSDAYAHFTDEEMRAVRKAEQKKAATIGEYSAVAMLDYPSSAVKDPRMTSVVDDIKRVIEASGPSVVYTHNVADKHDTHVAVALRTIQALRELPAEARPTAVYGCEAWRDLDWMDDSDKIVFDVGAHEDLAAALLGVFDSQISGGKRYDLATMGRRRAHATYYASHGTDVTTGMIFAMDLTPLVANPALGIESYVDGYIQRFRQDVSSRLARLRQTG